MGAPQPARAASAATAAARRKQLGAWYTPDALVEHVVDLVLEGAATGDAPLRVLDPACGDGRFLAAISRRLAGRVELVGCDIDPTAVAAAQRSLGTAATIIHADALSYEWNEGTFDIVVGNPPFLNQLSRATTRGGRSRYGGGPYADTAAVFLALSVGLARPDGGRVAMIVPVSVLTTRDAESIRTDLLDRAALRHLWWSPTAMFDAQVRTATLVFERGATQSDVHRTVGPSFAPVAPARLGRSWGALLLDDDLADTGPESAGGAASTDGPATVLGDLAVFSADFRAQYYGLVGAVGDDVDGPPLITSGLIDPGHCRWGEQPVRFAKQRFAAPRVALDRLSPTMQRWAVARLVPKVLIANQTRVIEAVVDRAGAWLPGVPVISAVPRPGVDLDAIMAILASPAATTWVRQHAAGSGLSADTVRVSPALLASIPRR
ncbi:MAG: N-6 DNA methylase [Actinomycetota bacterium]